jgi:integrase
VSVYKRGDRWWFSKTINGVRYRKPLPTARTKALADEAARHELMKLHRKRYGGSEDQLIADFIDKVYLPWARTNKRGHREDERNCATIKRWFRSYRFSQVSPLLVEKFKREELQRPVVRKRRIEGKLTVVEQSRRPATVNRVLACLSKIFSMARDAGLLSDNPCRSVRKLREDNRRERVLSPDEEGRLLAVCTGPRAHLAPIITLALNTGMRRGDLLTLRWEQVDFARGLIYVPNRKRGDSKGHWLPINSVVRQSLAALSLRRRDDGQVFGIADVKTAWRSALREAGITGLRFHDLRHTAATRLAEAGCDAFTIAAILGHSSIQTSARYTHASDERKRAAMEAIVTRSEASEVCLRSEKPVTIRSQWKSEAVS